MVLCLLRYVLDHVCACETRPETALSIVSSELVRFAVSSIAFASSSNAGRVCLPESRSKRV